MRKINQKKGDVFQVLFMMIIILVVSIVGLLVLVITTRVNSFWDSSGLLNGTAVGINAIDTLQDTAPLTTDYAILFIFIGMNIGVMIAAVRTNFTPLTVMLFIFLMFISIIIAAMSVNIYQGFAQTDSIIDVSAQLTFTNFLFSKYFPLVINVICALIMLLMYGKSGGDIVS